MGTVISLLKAWKQYVLMWRSLILLVWLYSFSQQIEYKYSLKILNRKASMTSRLILYFKHLKHMFLWCTNKHRATFLKCLCSIFVEDTAAFGRIWLAKFKVLVISRIKPPMASCCHCCISDSIWILESFLLNRMAQPMRLTVEINHFRHNNTNWSRGLPVIWSKKILWDLHGKHPTCIEAPLYPTYSLMSYLYVAHCWIIAI